MSREGGSRIGAAVLYREHARYVAGFLLRIGVPRSEVEDLVQEVFLTAHRKGGFEPGRAKATTWLCGIATRLWSNRKRSMRRKPTEALEPTSRALESTAPDPEREVSNRRSLERLNRALDALDEDHRPVFVLFELDGMSCAEIAEGLGVPVGTIYRRLHTARKRVRAAYEAQEVANVG